MLFIDRLLVGGVRFVLDKVATAVESELDDTGRLREELLEAQMRLELGQIDEEEFAAVEATLMARLRELREAELAAADQDAADGVSSGWGDADVSVELFEGHDEER